MTAEADNDDGGKPAPKVPGGSVLSKKAGPFSVGVWAMLLAGGVVLGAVLRSRRSKGTTGTDAPAAVVASEPVDPNRTTPLYGGSLPPVPVDDRPKTNGEWKRRAVTMLVAKGIGSAEASSALARFLNGEAVNDQEYAIIAMAIELLGDPPEGVPAIKRTTAPAPSNPTTPAPPPTPGTPSQPPPATPAGPIDRYPEADNLTLIETANDLLYKPNNEPSFSAMRDSLAVRVRDGKLCGSDRGWYEDQNPARPALLIREHVGARMAGLRWTGRC